MANRIQLRRDTAANWTSENPTLSSGEAGYETDTGLLKIGDGSTAWTSLDYFAGSGSSGNFEYQTEITANTTLDGSQKGLNKVYPVNNTAARTITITTGDYVENDVINIERRGQGSVEIIADTGVRIRGVRNIDNEYFINDPNSMVSVICRGSEEFAIIGNLTRGYTGAVTTSSYGILREGDTNTDVAVIGTGFSDNMLVSVSANATLNSFTVNSSTSLTLNLTAVGSETDTITVTYDNGDVFVDTDAITIAAPAETYDDYTAWYKLDETSVTVVTDQSGNYDGTNEGTTDIDNTGQVNKSYAFNGTDNYISGLGTMGITSFPCTFDFWIKLANTTGNKWVLAHDNQFNYVGVGIYVADAKMAVQFGDGAGTSSTDRLNYVTDSDVFSTGTWHHVSIVCTDKDTVTFKIDNTTETNSLASGTAASVSFTGLDYMMARKVVSGTVYYSFELDEFKAWNRALTSTEQTDINTLESAGNPMIS